MLAAILIVAAVLRLYGLDAESAWLDEAFSVGIARDGLETVLYETRLDVHPPLYYFLLRGWVLVAGPSVWAARLLSVIFSLGIVAATATIGVQLVGRRAALFASALLAVSVFQIEFAQEARMYALLALLATLSTWGFVRLFEGPDRRWFAFYVVITSLMTYTHVYGLFIIAAQGLSALADLVWRRGASGAVWLRWLAAQLLVFIAFLPWLPVFTWQVSLVQASFWIGEPARDSWLAAFLTYAGSEPLRNILLVLAVAGAWRVSRPGQAPPLPRPPLFFLLPWLLGPILFPFALSYVGSPIFLPKYTIAASVPFALLAGSGIVLLRWRSAQAAVLIACLMLSARALPDYYGVQSKDGWREAVASVESRARPDDLIVVYPYFNAYAYDLYRSRADVIVRPFPLYGPPPPEDGWDVTLGRAVAGYDRIWFVTLQADPTARVALDAIETRFSPVSRDLLQRIAIYQLERTP